MLSRRAFIAGGLVATAAAGLGAIELAGLDSDPPTTRPVARPEPTTPPRTWEVVAGAIRSRHLLAPAAWAMARPPRTRLEGVLLCLHGRNADHRYAFDAVGVHDAMADARLPVAVAAVDGGPNSYWHGRADGTDAGAMLVDDFVPFVRERLNVNRIAVLGWSMGGYGALLAAERHPRLFDAVVASSPALSLRAEEAQPGAFDDRADFDENDVFAGIADLDPRRVRIDCGRGDRFLAAAMAFAERLGPEATTSFPEGEHHVSYWRTAAPAQVRFAAAAMGALPAEG